MKKLIYLSGMLLLAMGLTLITSCSDDEDYVAASGEVVTSITTGEAIFTAVSAEITGTVSGLEKLSATSYEVGVLYSTAADPTTGTKVRGTLTDGTISASLTGLTPGTTYYYVAYALLQSHVYRYGDVKSFVATDANIATAGIVSITPTKATIQGQYRGSEGVDDVVLGIAVSTKADAVANGDIYLPDVDNIGEAQYTTLLDNLLPSTTYFAAAYMQLGGSTEWGEAVEFTTPDQTMEYVDLGLSVLWASANIGGEQPHDAGAKMAFANASEILQKIQIDADGNNISALPTKAQVAELIAGTTQTEETVDGVKGVRFTAANGNSIFLPSAIYWTGEGLLTNSSYANTLDATTAAATVGASSRILTYGVRTVAEEVVREGIRIKRSKVLQGELEDNGNYRIEIYNEYGAGTASDSPIDLSAFNPESSIEVTFTLAPATPLYSGVPGYISYAAGGWYPSVWGDASSFGNVDVTGFGTYTQKVTFEAEGDDVIVFVIDIAGYKDFFGEDILAKTTATVDKILVNGSTEVPVDNSKIICGDIENNGNFRIEIYNEYGAGTAADPVGDEFAASGKNTALDEHIVSVGNRYMDGGHGITS